LLQKAFAFFQESVPYLGPIFFKGRILFLFKGRIWSKIFLIHYTGIHCTTLIYLHTVWCLWYISWLPFSFHFRNFSFHFFSLCPFSFRLQFPLFCLKRNKRKNVFFALQSKNFLLHFRFEAKTNGAP
jgi:hypothetical protein